MSEVSASELDGRRLRTQRSKLAMVEAALELIDEGVLLPTAQLVSERAGVGMRTFFRHFSDMEAFFDAVNQHARDTYAQPFVGGDRSGTLEDRIEHAVQKRGTAYDQVSNVMQSTEAMMWHSEVLRTQHAGAERALMRDLEIWLPEVRRLKKPDREAVHAVASFSMWHRLRAHQGLGQKASMNIVIDLLRRLLDH